MNKNISFTQNFSTKNPTNVINSKTIIISGMHRSGTSLIAKYFSHCGMHVGDNLLAAAFDNPDGYYEDVDFISIHELMLKENGASWHSQPRGSNLEVGDQLRRKILELIAQRKDLPLWGWKDPRTILFLDFWADLLPDAVFVFVYRNPTKVMRSLLKRGDDALFWHPVLGPRIQSRFKAARLWARYNSMMLQFLTANPHRCILFDLEEVIDANADVAGIVRDRFDVCGLSSAPIQQVLNRSIMSAEGDIFDRLVQQSYPPSRRVYKSLREKRYRIG